MFTIPNIIWFLINSAWPVLPWVFPDDPQEINDYLLFRMIGKYGFTSGFI